MTEEPEVEKATDQPEYSESTQDLTVGAGARMESEFLRITEEDKILPTTAVWSLLAVVLGDILDRLEVLEND